MNRPPSVVFGACLPQRRKLFHRPPKAAVSYKFFYSTFADRGVAAKPFSQTSGVSPGGSSNTVSQNPTPLEFTKFLSNANKPNGSGSTSASSSIPNLLDNKGNNGHNGGLKGGEAVSLAALLNQKNPKNASTSPTSTAFSANLSGGIISQLLTKPPTTATTPASPLSPSPSTSQFSSSSTTASSQNFTTTAAPKSTSFLSQLNGLNRSGSASTASSKTPSGGFRLAGSAPLSFKNSSAGSASGQTMSLFRTSPSPAVAPDPKRMTMNVKAAGSLFAPRQEQAKQQLQQSQVEEGEDSLNCFFKQRFSEKPGEESKSKASFQANRSLLSRKLENRSPVGKSTGGLLNLKSSKKHQRTDLEDVFTDEDILEEELFDDDLELETSASARPSSAASQQKLERAALDEFEEGGSELDYPTDKPTFTPTPKAKAKVDSPSAMEEQPVIAKVKRPPVVTIMGHVDHGKTTILDKLRNSNIALGEAGGITQTIGAFQVPVNGELITFIDTPGHEAFSSMRSTGAQVTDLVILVIAADSGIQPQTREVIQLVQWLQLPLIVAINKVDKGQQMVPQILSDLYNNFGIDLEDFGGNTQVVKLSALTGQGIKELLDAVLLWSEIAELEGEVGGISHGIVIESHKEEGKGQTVHAVIRQGNLEVGNFLVYGSQVIRVKALKNDKGESIPVAALSQPVEVIGLKSPLPRPGSKLLGFRNQREATDAAAEVKRLEMEGRLEEISQREKIEEHKRLVSHNASRRNLSDKEKKDLRSALRAKQVDVTARYKVPTLEIILRADFSGSLQAIEKLLSEVNLDILQVKPLRMGVGAITQDDIELASFSGAELLSFNADYHPNVIPKDTVTLRKFDIIYHLLDHVKAEMVKKLPMISFQEKIGVAQVKKLFKVGKKVVAGCLVTSGIIEKDTLIQVIREPANAPPPTLEGETPAPTLTEKPTNQIYEGPLVSLRHLQDEVEYIEESQECGIQLDTNDIKEGDTLICIKEVKRYQSVAEVFGTRQSFHHE